MTGRRKKASCRFFMIGVLIVVGKVLAGGEPITPRLFIGRMLLGGFCLDGCRCCSGAVS
ncbi:phage lysis holin [Escherichia coli]|nr:phage lysis holin [Escherichia coli]